DQDVPVGDRHLAVIRGESVDLPASEFDGAVETADPIVELALGQLAHRVHEFQGAVVAVRRRSAFGLRLPCHMWIPLDIDIGITISIGMKIPIPIARGTLPIDCTPCNGAEVE